MLNQNNMNKTTSIKLFEDKKVRSLWDSEQEKWYISIVDVVGALTESVDSAAYWRKLKQRLKAEGNETVTNCHGLKMQSADGKFYKTYRKRPSSQARRLCCRCRPTEIGIGGRQKSSFKTQCKEFEINRR